MENEVVKEILTRRDWFDYLSIFGDLLVAPVVAAVFGFVILRITKRIEHSQWRNQKLIEKRIELWDEVGPTINDIYCYCMRVGSWKDFKPYNIVEKKRISDKCFYQNRPYFSDDLVNKYDQMIKRCFDIFQGHGVDAKIKTSLSEHRNVHSDWDPSWDSSIADILGNEVSLRKSYFALLDQVRMEITDG